MSSWHVFIFLGLWTQHLTCTCSLNAVISRLVLHDVTVTPSEDVNVINCTNGLRVSRVHCSDSRRQQQKPEHMHGWENEGYRHFSHFSLRFFWQQFDLHTTVLLLFLPYILKHFQQWNLNTIKAIKAYQQQHRANSFLNCVTTLIENETFEACCWSRKNQCETEMVKDERVRHFYDEVTHTVLVTLANPFKCLKTLITLWCYWRYRWCWADENVGCTAI